MALHRATRRGLAQRGHLYDHPELSAPRRQHAGIPDGRPGPTALDDDEPGPGLVAQPLEVTAPTGLISSSVLDRRGLGPASSRALASDRQDPTPHDAYIGPFRNCWKFLRALKDAAPVHLIDTRAQADGR